MPRRWLPRSPIASSGLGRKILASSRGANFSAAAYWAICQSPVTEILWRLCVAY